MFLRVVISPINAPNKSQKKEKVDVLFVVVVCVCVCGYFQQYFIRHVFHTSHMIFILFFCVLLVAQQNTQTIINWL